MKILYVTENKVIIMTENNEKSEFITFPKTFEKYKWYKPLLVFIVTIIFYVIFSVALLIFSYGIYGESFVTSIINGGYEVLNSEGGQILSDLGIIILIPAIYLATKVVKDRPFSSYSSSRGGWNIKLYFKALIIPLILFLIFEGIDVAMNGAKGTYHFSIGFLLICLILVPLQCIAEEYLYRGLIMQTLGSWFNIPILAIIIQAIIFSVSHGYNTIGLVEIVVAGIIYGFFTWKTNGIEVSSALHTANNLSISLLVMFGLSSSTSSALLNDVIIAIVFEILLAILMYYIGKKTNWFGELE